ncbi:phosphoadenosine phosphosulfate reductase domain-containing protein [Clostridium estertheticum]|uniref:phosphoadenosine phosphosulfate reductase domain-containing protein n=1 Tax=Clostridium estertheticum TaxID=238834 RepID=UPI001C0C36D9|nr:phosphoadenosine phosphosulfate reductase family protein [Clostridium estertheticum]MBU3173319.1 phosphoadenosine phosphosulfate reductase family protein [Clostridium estertheticum]
MNINELKLLQNLDYEIKNLKTDLRVEEWVKYWGSNNVAVSLSGGLDSCVLLHKVRNLYPRTKAVSIKAIECKENQKIVENIENVVYLTSKYNQVQILKKFGFPICSKKTAKSIRRLQNPTARNLKSRNLALTGITSDGRPSPRFKLPKKWLKLIDSPYKVSEQCCYYMKEKPLLDYAKDNDIHYFIGTKAEDSETRQSSYLGTGCNSFSENGNSNPLGFWTHQDVLRYIVENNLPVSKIYGDIVEVGTKRIATKLKVRLLAKYDRPIKLITTKASRSGCFICGFGVHLEKQPNRFQRMEIDDPKLWDFAINKLGYGKVLDFINVPYMSNIDIKKDMNGEYYQQFKII